MTADHSSAEPPRTESTRVGRSLRYVGDEVLATLATAASLLGRVRPSLQRSLEGATPTSGYAPKTEVREGLVSWFISLRWVAVVVSTAVVGFAVQISHRVRPESAPDLWGGVATLAALNAVWSLLGPRRLASQRAFAMQVAGDVGALGWLIHHAGGLQNPFASFFVFHAAIAAVALEARQARATAIAIAGFVLALAALEASVLPPDCLLRGAESACSAGVDWLFHVAAGAAVAAMVVGCAFIVVALVRVLRMERERLARVTATLVTRAEELTAAKTEIQQEQEQLQTIVDCMADAVIYLTPDGMVGLHNRAAEQFWPEGVRVGGGLKNRRPPEEWMRLIEKVSAPKAVELHPMFQMNGRSHEFSYARVYGVDGNIRGVVMVARDVTERLETQRWRMQEERMAVTGKLAAVLAHELNNPLGAIALFTQHALAEHKPTGPLAEHLGTVLRNANLCKRIVRDFIEYARQGPPERRQVALSDLLGDVMRTLEPHARRSAVAIRCEARGRGDVSVDGDPDQLRQVLLNLGLNGIEAMPNGGTLVFRLEPGPRASVQIGVVDTGVGIPPGDQEQIFAAFHTTKPEGTGLGLTVARDIVAAHGGTIEVVSTPGKGTAFTVTIPSQGEAQPVEAGS